MIAVADDLLSLMAERDITDEMVLDDLATQWMITTPLYEIGEQSNHLSHDLVDAHPDIPFIQIAGLRHRLVHDYEDTDWNLILDIVRNELSDLMEKIIRLIR